MRIFLILKPFLARFLIVSLTVIIISSPVIAITRIKAGLSINETQGKKINLVPESILDSSLLLEGDYFSAWLNKEASEILQLPSGSRIIGLISQITRAGSFNRPATVEVTVTNLLLPDGTILEASGRLISNANWQSKPDATPFTSQAVQFSSKLLASSLVGAVDTLQYTGIATAIATSGISVAAGAAIGLGLGLIGITKKQGQTLISSGFYQVPFRIESEIISQAGPDIGQKLVPFTMEAIGVDVQVRDIQKLYSKDFGDFLVLDISLSNHSDRKLFLGDFVLSSSVNVVPVLNNPLITNDGFKSLDLEKSENFRISFSLGNLAKAEDYKLMLIDAVTQEVVANADIDISAFL
jgi:hypothetical protein